jgi:hypothetical protein
VARDLLNAHRQAFPDFGSGLTAVDHGIVARLPEHCFWLTVFVTGSLVPRSLRNFVAQASSDMMRLGPVSLPNWGRWRAGA